MSGIDGPSPSLSVDLCGMHFRNPFLLASGIADETGLSMARAVKKGAGGVVTKSLSIEPREGHPNPCVVELPFGALNAMGLPNPGIASYKDEVAVYRGETKGRAPIIASVFGRSIEEYAEASHLAEGIGADAIELNGSCPNAKGLGLQFGQDPSVIEDLVKAVKARTARPVFFKLTPNTQDIASLALAAQKGGADGVVAINTLQAMKIDVRTGRPVLTNVTGGLSGPAIRPVGVRCVYEIFRTPGFRLPVIGVGGIVTAEDALEYMMAGASLVQVGTAVSWGNLDVFGSLERGLRTFMTEIGYDDISSIVGKAHKGGRRP